MRIPSIVLALIAVATCSLWPAAGYAQFPKRVKTKGQISAVAQGKILLTDEANKLITFNIRDDQNVVAVQGKLALTDLKPGTFVRVEGTLKGNEIEGEVSQIKVFSAADGYEAGIAQDAKDQPAIVTGAVKLLKDNTLTIQAGKKRVTAKLAKDVAVTLDSKDYTLAPTGAQVEAEGYETKNGSVNAKKVVITVGKVESNKKPTDPKAGKTAKKEDKKTK